MIVAATSSGIVARPGCQESNFLQWRMKRATKTTSVLEEGRNHHQRAVSTAPVVEKRNKKKRLIIIQKYKIEGKMDRRRKPGEGALELV